MAGSGLSGRDLAELTDASPWQFEDDLRTTVGRTFACSPGEHPVQRRVSQGIGDAFAQTEILTVLAAVIWRWRLVQAGEPALACDVTYRLKESVMRVERR